MRISVADAEGQLDELIRLAEGGEEILLTRNGQAAVRLQLVKKAIDPHTRDRMIEEIQRRVDAQNPPEGPDAARSQDYLYDELGLPK
jgi:antitoxin (DNA-binding transcriptional repressor) of toxin-antitoxin stability system